MIELTLEQYEKLVRESARLDVLREYMETHKYPETKFIRSVLGVSDDD